MWSDPNIRFFADGHMPHDIPHQIKFLGSYILPYEINFGWFYVGHSGMPYTRTGVFRRGISETSDTALVRSETTRFIEERSSRRLDWVNNVDVRAEKAFTIGRFTVAALIDVFNLFNANTVTQVEVRDDPRPGARAFETATRIKFPRNYRIGFRLDW